MKEAIKEKDFWIRLWLYFHRGHHFYLGFLMGFANFVVIQYTLLVSRVNFLKSLFSHFWYFVVIWLVLYPPIAIIIGYLDYKKASIRVASELQSKVSPYARDLAKAISLIAKGKNKEAEEILKRWYK